MDTLNKRVSIFNSFGQIFLVSRQLYFSKNKNKVCYSLLFIIEKYVFILYKYNIVMKKEQKYGRVSF